MFQIPDSPEYGPAFRFPGAWEKDDDQWVEDVFQGDETEPQPLFQADIQDDYSAYSPPLWKTCTTTSPDIRPLLPPGHPCSDLSPQSMTHIIANSREEMMKMIRDLPESSYELSLKDIVDLHSSQETKVEPSIEEEPVFFLNPIPQPVKPNKKMTRSDSMNNNPFLIKTLFPSFSLSKRKSVPGNSSRIIPRSSSRSKDKIHPRDKEAPRITNNNKFRNEDDKHETTTGCWPSINPRKLKTWRCLL